MQPFDLQTHIDCIGRSKPPYFVIGILAKVTSPKFTEDEISLLLSKALERRSVSKEDIEAISQMQKALREGNKAFGSGDASGLSDELQQMIAGQ